MLQLYTRTVEASGVGRSIYIRVRISIIDYSNYVHCTLSGEEKHMVSVDVMMLLKFSFSEKAVI